MIHHLFRGRSRVETHMHEKDKERHEVQNFRAVDLFSRGAKPDLFPA